MTNQRQYTPRLRLLSAVLAAAMAMTVLPMAAFAEDVTDYLLAVNGTRVTSANAGDILQDGKASYDDTTKTLTLQGDIATTDNAVNPFGEQLTVTGKSTLTGTQRDWYAGLCGTKTIKVAADADITLDTFGFGINYAGADISGNVKIRNVEYGVSSGGTTIQSTGKLVIENADKAVSGSGVKVYGTLEIHDGTQAVSDGGITVYEGGKASITGAASGLNGQSRVDGGILSVSANTCIDNGAVIFSSGTLILESAGGSPLALYPAKLNVQPDEFWYRTEKDGAWTHVTDGSWVRPSDSTYFELTTNDPTQHYTVTFDLNGGESWGGTDSDSLGQWNDDHSQLVCTTRTGDTGEALTVPLMQGMGPARTDYVFEGWYTAPVGGEPVEKQPYYMSNQHLEPITGDITFYAHWLWNGEGPEPDDPIIDDGGSGAGIALAVVGGAVAVGAAGFGAYELATRAILKNLLPAGADIPATRGELAVLLWQNAGKPEPAAQPAFADVADAQTAKAAQWCTEQGLLETEDGAFRPEQRVAKYRVIQVWKQAAAPQK